MSNNKQPVELTDITVPLLAATQGLTMEDRDASTSTPIIYKTIDILLDCAERGHNRGKQRPSICKVSRLLRDHSESSFTPQLVSIGPIHRENQKLQEFEWLKECYLDDLLNRSDSTPKETLEACLLKVNTLIPQIRESYADMIKNYSDVELAKMMVMDGCFILEFCFKHEDEENLYLPNKVENLRIAMDLMLLENQVPFFVLQALFDCLATYMGSVTLSNVLDEYLAPYIILFSSPSLPEKNSSNVLVKYLAPYIKLFRSLLPQKFSTTDVASDLPKKISTTNVDSDSTPAHVLGYLHKRFQLVVADQERTIEKPYTALHSIVELERSGIEFKPHQKGDWSMTIKFQSPLFQCLPWFWSKPTLLMPTLVIDDTTELIFRNFIAYEQSSPQVRDCFTQYAVAMDTLIDTQEDIAKLVESKVLFNNPESNQEAADMINKMGKNISVTDFYYIQAFEQMDDHCNLYWPKKIATMRRNIAWQRRVYLDNPWNFIALVAAIILFGLTVVQTIYTIRAA